MTTADKIKSLEFPSTLDVDAVVIYCELVDQIDWVIGSNLKPHGRVSELIHNLFFKVERIHDANANLQIINSWVAGQYDAGNF